MKHQAEKRLRASFNILNRKCRRIHNMRIVKFTFFIVIILSGCSFSHHSDLHKTNPAIPKPGSAVIATGTGSTAVITWGQASDDEGAEWLTYKLIRSKLPIKDLSEAELLPDVIQNFSEYSKGAVYDTGVSPGIYYYNVIVKDDHGNKALYKDDSAESVSDKSPPAPGNGIIADGAGTTVKITWEEADDDSLPVGLEYKIVRSDTAVTTLTQAENITDTDIVRDYDEYGTGVLYDIGLAIGTHYYNIIVRDASGNKALYKCDSAETIIDALSPVPGNGVIITQKGRSVEIVWEEAEDNSLPAGLMYKAVRSESSIDTLGEADAALVIQDYAFYDGAGAVDQDLNVETTYYYNVIVKDASGNRSLYSCDSVNITFNTVSGTITLPDYTAENVKVIIDNDSNYYNGYARSVSAVKQSGLEYTYTLDNIYNGSYYVYARVDNEPYGSSLAGNDFCGYYGGYGINPPENANLAVSSADKQDINFSLTKIPQTDLYTVSGKIRAPSYLSSGSYYIALDIDGDLNTTNDWHLTSGDWPSNTRQIEYTINYVPKGKYNIFVLVTEFPDNFYCYQSDKASLNVVDVDVTGLNIIVSAY